jgi:hypothetical protein
MIVALQPLVRPTTASAQADYRYLYIEPRTTIIRRPDGGAQMQGRVVIDMRNGNVWGFPTLSSAPYPVDTMKPIPPVSEPMYLGKFDFSKIDNK